MNDGADSSSYNSYGFESTGRSNGNVNSSGSTALYHHNGSRYGLGLGGRTNGADSKMNGLHGSKHKRGDADRECKSPRSLVYVMLITSFTSQSICGYPLGRLAGRDTRLV